jgi:hypothetical protein
MPTDGDTRPCTFSPCKGTMKYEANALRPGDRMGVPTGGPDDPVLFSDHRNRGGWFCSLVTVHFTLNDPN